MALISVIIPSYNRAHLIGRAIESVQSQPMDDIEIIIVDDGSTDNTAEIVQKYSSDDKRIKYLSYYPNRGAQHARNYGIQHSKGEWIAFLDSDDELTENSLSGRFCKVNYDKNDAIYSPGYQITMNFKEKNLFCDNKNEGNILSAILSSSFILFQGLMVKKSKLIEIGLLDESILSFQEWDTAIRLAKICSFSYYPYPAYIYHCEHSGETISKNSMRTALGYEQNIHKHMNEIVTKSGLSSLYNHYSLLVMMFIQANDKKKALRYYLKKTHILLILAYKTFFHTEFKHSK